MISGDISKLQGLTTFVKTTDKQKSDADNDEDGNLHLEDKVLKKFVEKTYQVIDKIDNIGLPEPGQQLRIITMKVFNAISVIQLIAEREIITDAVFVIFAINQHAARMLIDLKNKGYIKKAQLVVSSIRNAGHESKSVAVDMLKKYFQVIYVNSHAKISVIKTEKGNYYNVEGSGNFSFNGRIEQYVIDNDIEIYNFSQEWIEELQKYKMK